METSGQGRGLTVWDFIPATLTVVLGVLTNWLSDIWQPAVPVIVGGTLLSIVALDVRLNRASGSPGRLRGLGDQHVLLIAASGLIVGFGLGWLGGLIPEGPSIPVSRGRFLILSYTAVGFVAAVPAVVSAYRRRKPLWWITYNAFTAFGLATGLTYGSDWFWRIFLQYFAAVTAVCALVRWGRRIIAAFLDMMGVRGATEPERS